MENETMKFLLCQKYEKLGLLVTKIKMWPVKLKPGTPIWGEIKNMMRNIFPRPGNEVVRNKNRYDRSSHISPFSSNLQKFLKLFSLTCQG